MTQFALATTGTNSPRLKPVEELHNDFLTETAVRLFSDYSLSEIFVIDGEGGIDSLMLDAQKLVIESSKFEETPLYEVIEKLAQTVDELIFWYGSDFNDLEWVYDAPALLNKLKEAVNTSSCELYIHYKNKRINGVTIKRKNPNK